MRIGFLLWPLVVSTLAAPCFAIPGHLKPIRMPADALAPGTKVGTLSLFFAFRGLGVKGDGAQSWRGVSPATWVAAALTEAGLDIRPVEIPGARFSFYQKRDDYARTVATVAARAREVGLDAILVTYAVVGIRRVSTAELLDVPDYSELHAASLLVAADGRVLCQAFGHGTISEIEFPKKGYYRLKPNEELMLEYGRTIASFVAGERYWYTHVVHANVHLAIGKREEAARALERALERAPEGARAFVEERLRRLQPDPAPAPSGDGAP